MKHWQDSPEGLGYWRHDDLRGTAHGFFSRKGGVSEGLFTSLNGGFGSSDARENVEENRTRMSLTLGAPSAINTVHQCHTNLVEILHAPFSSAPPQKDALVTNTPNLPIAVLTADCAPILFADTTAGVIGAAHAGWKGAFDEIALHTVEAMESLGAKRETTKAVIGPCIGPAAYEVGQEFLERFTDEDMNNAQYFTNATSGKYLFDLPRFLLTQMREFGIGDVSWIGECTFSNKDLYYSYRRTTHRQEPDYGRLVSAIMITKEVE